MFTDMVGYTALGQKNEALALSLLDEQKRVVRPVVRRHNGNEVKSIGDALLVEFPSALDAVRCAYDIQRSIRELNFSLPDDRRLHMRVGIHLGDIVESEGDISGDAVNVASRIEPLAENGGVCLSRQIYDHVENKFEIPLTSLGLKSLKNVTSPLEVYKMVMPWESNNVASVTSAPMHDRKRIAVLPFSNISADPENEYFADGMTEELISAVSKIPELSVISRTSVMGYKNLNKRAGEIGAELRIGTLLEGSIRKAGNRVRIAVQLIDANTDEHLWAENYDRKLEDVFVVQGEIAQNVASTLKIHLLERDVARLSRVPTKDPVAHEFFMKGMSLMTREGSEGDLKIALDYFEKAIKQDPKYADPYRIAAEVYYRLAGHEIVPLREALQKMVQFANAALELDNVSAESHVTKGWVLWSEMDFRGWKREIQRAIELNPNLEEAHRVLALHFLATCELEKALSECQKALELAPLSARTIIAVATLYLYGGDPDAALELYQKADPMDPGNPFVIENTGLCYVRKGMYDQGIANIKEGLALRIKVTPNDLADLPYALASAGRIEEARDAVLNLVKYCEKIGSGTITVAKGYAAIGEKDKAMEWLERAYSEHAPGLIWSRVDFNLEGMHSDPRFEAFVRKLGLVPDVYS